jgi:signal transduction histidine kinase/CheY-like chemotaxis protein
VAYVLVSFGACIVALGVVMANSTAASFERERGRARADLRAAAQSNADLEAGSFEQVSDVLSGLAEQASISSLNPATCSSAFEGLESVADQGSIYLLRGDRSPVCSLLARRRPVVDVPPGAWFGKTLRTGEPQYGGVRVEPASGVPQVIFSVPVPAAADPAVLVAVLDGAVPPLDIPSGAAKGTVVVELDTARGVVVSTSKDAPVQPGTLAPGSAFRVPLGPTHTQRDADGVERIYEQVKVPGFGRVVLAGVPLKVALQQANADRNRNLELAAAILCLVGILGFAVQRRVAKPLAHLQAAIRDAGDDGSVIAVVAGPAEVMALADEFNATMAKRRDLEADLEASVARAEDASRMKSLFLANVSHEIRTPMNGVLGMISLFRDEPLSEVHRDYLDTMEGSAEALLAIINDLLDFSKIEAGMVEIEAVDFSLEGCVRAAVAPWVPAARHKRVRLSVAIDPSVPDAVRGDPHRLRQVISNLVDNAVKFTLDGTVEVHVRPSTAGRVLVEVTDTGIGIGDRNGEDLFDAFVQGDPSTTRRFGGTGLGLAICKQLVTLMEGHIDARGRVEGGSVFWFELPLPVAPTIHSPALPTQPSARPMSGAVLLAEDNPVNQKVAQKLIEQLGFAVDIANNGHEAVQKVDANRYVAVLMDLQMPGMDGFEATTTIRNDLHSSVPIIALSASVLPEDRARCLDIGMDGHLAKPIDRVALRAALERAVAASAW